MGIRKEIKEVLRTMDVRDPRQALVVIESLVNLPKAPKPDSAPSITIIKIGDDEYDVVGNGIPLKDSPGVLIRALKAVARTLADDNGCKGCPNKEGCRDAK